MTSVRILIVAFCMAGFACGAEDASNNAAHNKIFTYGAPSAASVGLIGAVQSPIEQAAREGGVSGAADVVASFGPIRDALLGTIGSPFLPGAGPARAVRARVEDRKLNADCLTLNGNTGTFKNCPFTFDSGGFHVTGTLDGTVSVSSDERSLSWNLSVKENLSDGVTSENVTAHESGSVTVEPNHVQGDMLTEVSVSGSRGADPTAFGVDEEVMFNLGFASSPFCITTGTLEAKRVWTQQSGTKNPDKAAKLTWTGCRHATVAVSQ
jgi:hypothetical protein